MIQMMDRNRNGKLDKREMGMMDLDELLKNPEAAKVRAYVPDLDELVKKVLKIRLILNIHVEQRDNPLIQTKRIIRKADMDHDKAYDDRELAKVMLDVANLMVKRGFN